MYPVRLGFNTATKRVRLLISNGHEAEAVVAVTATAEKTFRRVLKQLIVAAGFASSEADKLAQHFRGLEAIKSVWPRFDPAHRGLPSVVGNSNWEAIKEAQTARNRLVHGKSVLSKAAARELAKKALAGLVAARKELDATYGFDGWGRMSVRRKGQLHVDPRVKTGE